MSKALIIIPTYNEKENIALLVEAITNLPKPFDILIVDDDSPDQTADIIKSLQNRYNTDTDICLHLVQRTSKQGLGTAYICGFKYALQYDYEYILEMDADFSHDPKDLVRLYDTCFEKKADMAIGSRYIVGVNVVNWSIKRVLLSYFASVYVRWITRMPIRDTTAGFVCYRREVLETIALDKVKLIGYAFQIEMKFLAWKHGFKLIEIPIIFTERVRGKSKLSTGIFKEAFFGILYLAIKGLFTKYKASKK